MPNGKYIPLGQWIRDKRESLGLTQEEVCIRANVSQGQLSQLENGKKPEEQYSSSMIQILLALEVPSEEVIEYVDRWRGPQP